MSKVKRGTHRFPDEPLITSRTGKKAPACPGFRKDISNLDFRTSFDHASLLAEPCTLKTWTGVCKRPSCKLSILNFTEVKEWKAHLNSYKTGFTPDTEISANNLRKIMASRIVSRSKESRDTINTDRVHSIETVLQAEDDDNNAVNGELIEATARVRNALKEAKKADEKKGKEPLTIELLEPTPKVTPLTIEYKGTIPKKGTATVEVVSDETEELTRQNDELKKEVEKLKNEIDFQQEQWAIERTEHQRNKAQVIELMETMRKNNINDFDSDFIDDFKHEDVTEANLMVLIERYRDYMRTQHNATDEQIKNFEGGLSVQKAVKNDVEMKV